MTTTQAGFVLQHLRRLACTQRADQQPDGHLLERFTAQGDQAAFATLVQRHGPMVLNVCRSVLRHEQDAEDAFQATFLVLARKAASVRQPQAVAGWLYEVAYHAAVKAQASAARRRAQERKVSPMTPADPTLDMTVRDLHRVLHEELQRLPERYRLPLVLCYLEGRSQGEAAVQLGWSKGTLRGRLDRGREHLRRRLAARGVTLSALLGTTAIAPKIAAETLVNPVVQAAVGSAVDGATAGALSARVSALAEGVIRAMFLTKAKSVTAVVFAVGLMTVAGAFTHQALSAPETETVAEALATPGRAQQAAAKEKPQPLPADAAQEAMTYSGRVLDSDGKPVAGAKLYLTLSWSYLKRPAPSPVYATTGSDGRFRFTLAHPRFGQEAVAVVATAAGHGPAWIDLKPGESKDELMLSLVKDDVPINGQILDLQGRPVPGAAVRILHIRAAPKEELTPWREAAKARKERSYELEKHYLPRQLMNQEIPDLPHQVTADVNGRFRLTGIGRERMVAVQIEGPTIATRQARIVTRPGEAIEVPEFLSSLEPGIAPNFVTYYGATFRHTAAPTKPIAGVVRDRDTKKPLAGVTVQSLKLANNPMHGIDFVRTTTDAQGRYRLTGMPKGPDNKIMVVPSDSQPYLPAHVEVADTPGFEPVTIDFELKQGVWVEGRITDQVTGKPLPAHVEYFALGKNPHLADYPGFDGAFASKIHHNAGADGSFRVVGLPGPGVLAVQYSDHYLLAQERDDEDGTKEPQLNTVPYVVVAISYNAFARIDPPKEAKSVKRDVVLAPGETFTGTALGLDGKPLPGTRAYGLSGWNGWSGPLEKAEFALRAFNPRRPRSVLFLHAEKRLVGILELPKDKATPITVRLQPGAAVTGRLVDSDGRPRANAELHLSFRGPKDFAQAAYSPNKIKTDQAGRFRIECLVPGFRFELYDPKGWYEFGEGLRFGETKDLGNVLTKRADE